MSTHESPPPRAGSDWLTPTATIAPRAHSRRARARLYVTALIVFAIGVVAWRFSDVRATSREPLSFALVDVGATAGVDFVHHLGSFAPFYDNVKPFMAAVSASACVADVDGDGDLDIYFTNAGDGARNVLYLNDGRMHFVDAGWHVLDGDNGRDGFSSDCVFADVDNDGWPDLFVGSVSRAPKLFHNDGGHGFTDVSAASGIPDYMNGFAVSFVDVDNDGDLDLVINSYFAERYHAEDIAARPRVHAWNVPNDENAGRMLPNNWGNATNGGERHLLLNDGRGNFTAQDLAPWGLAPEFDGSGRFTFDIGTADVDGDGFTDLYFANDFGPDDLYLNDHGKRFVALRGALPTDIGRDSFKGMDAELADIDHDGLPEIYVTNVMHPILPEGNILWHNEGGHAFKNIAQEVGAKDGGWGWGAKFVDLDDDGDVDLVETNGYISQSRDREYWYRLSRLIAGDRRLIVDTKKWPAFEDMSMSGHQVSHVFVNDEDETGALHFANRASDAGLHREMDGRGVVVADFDGDGRPDIVLVAQGSAPQLLHNEFRATPRTPHEPHWLELVVDGDGAKVNRDAVGVRVELRPHDIALAKQAHAALPQFREISAGNGMSAQSMRWVHAGFGAYAGPIDVVVRWTDGTTTKLDALASNARYHVVRDLGVPNGAVLANSDVTR